MFADTGAAGADAPRKPHWAMSWISSFAQKYAAAAYSAPDEVLATKPKATKRVVRPADGSGKFTVAEVAEHSTCEDAWLIVDGKVYDVTDMKHPGGDVFYSYAGKDASAVFSAIHKNQPKTRAVLRSYCIGEVVASKSEKTQTPILADFDAMVEQFRKEGLFNANFTYYARKCTELLLMLEFSQWMLWGGSAANSYLSLVSSALLLAMFFFQCGWATHDFCHNQVFMNGKFNAIMGGIIMNLGMGGSVHWWKNKHNQHHATPNKMDAENKHAVDPDIDTIPLIAWSQNLMQQVDKKDRGMMLVQHVVMWPLLFIAYINWMAQSVVHLIFFPKISNKQRKIELGTIALHHIWVNVSIFYNLGFTWRAALYWTIAHCVAGFLTAYVFVQSHNGMEIYHDDKDFVTSQIVSTRNINPGPVADWIFGGLNYQIEHHLFPTMPRHNFSRVRDRVIDFCKRNSLAYESCSMWESTMKVYQHLAVVAKSG